MIRASAFVFMVAVSSAIAQPVCLPRDVFIERLADEGGEARQSYALTASGTILEFFGNADTGTWTIIEVRANGVACVAVSGMGWDQWNTPFGDPA